MREIGAIGLAMWILLSACQPAPEVARYSVDAYRADRALRERTLADCARDPGTQGNRPDCVNAQRAASLESRGSLRTAPPVGLAPPAEAAPDGSER